MYMGYPSDISKCIEQLDSFHLEFCWMEFPGKRQRLVRTFDAAGLAVSSTYFIETKIWVSHDSTYFVQNVMHQFCECSNIVHYTIYQYILFPRKYVLIPLDVGVHGSVYICKANLYLPFQMPQQNRTGFANYRMWSVPELVMSTMLVAHSSICISNLGSRKGMHWSGNEVDRLKAGLAHLF